MTQDADPCCPGRPARGLAALSSELAAGRSFSLLRLLCVSKIFNYPAIRRGSCLDTNRATVAMVTDDPEHKSAMREGLAGAFGEQECKSPMLC